MANVVLLYHDLYIGEFTAHTNNIAGAAKDAIKRITEELETAVDKNPNRRLKVSFFTNPFFYAAFEPTSIWCSSQIKSPTRTYFFDVTTGAFWEEDYSEFII